MPTKKDTPSNKEGLEGHHQAEETQLTKVSGTLIGTTRKGRDGDDEVDETQNDGPSACGPNQVLCLEIKGAGRDGEIHLIGQRLSVGRKEADLLLLASSISSLHCTFLVRQGVVSVTDNGSSNGTYVDGRRIRPGHMVILNIGDCVLVGKTQVVIVACHKDDPNIIVERANPNLIVEDPDPPADGAIGKIRGLWNKFKRNKGVKVESELASGENLIPAKHTQVVAKEFGGNYPTQKDFEALPEKRKAEDETDEMQVETPSFKSLDEMSASQIRLSKDILTGPTGEMEVGQSGREKRKKAKNSVKNIEDSGLSLDYTATKSEVKKNRGEAPDRTLGTGVGVSAAEETFSMPETKVLSKKKVKKKRINDRAIRPKGIMPASKNVRFDITIVTSFFMVRWMAFVLDVLMLGLFFKYSHLIPQYSLFKEGLKKWVAVAKDQLIHYYAQWGRPYLGDITFQNDLISAVFSLLKEHFDLVLVLMFWQMLTTLIWGVSLGQFLMGIGSHLGFLGNRLGGVVRVFLGFVTAPFLIFDLPMFFKRRTLKEVLTFTSLRSYSPVVRNLGLFVFFPLLVVMNMGLAFVIDTVENPDLFRGIAEIPVSSAFKAPTDQLPPVKSYKYNLSVPLEKESSLILLPAYHTTLVNNKKRIKGYLSFYDKQSKAIGKFKVVGKVNWQKIVGETQVTNFLFSRYQPELSNYAEGGSEDSELVKGALSDLVSAALTMNLASLSSSAALVGPLIDGLVYLRRRLLKTYGGEFLPAFERRSFGGLDFFILRPNPEYERELKSLKWVFFPISTDVLPVFSLEVSSEDEGKKAIKNFMNEIFSGVVFHQGVALKDDKAAPYPLKDKQVNAFSILDYYLYKKQQIGPKRPLIDKMFFYYYDAARYGLIEGDNRLLSLVQTHIRSLTTVHKAIYKRNLSDFIVNLKKMDSAISEENRRYFEVKRKQF